MPLLSLLLSAQAHAGLTGDFDNLCGGVVSNLGCADIASEYSVIFGSATAAVGVGKTSGIVNSDAQCKAKMNAKDPALKDAIVLVDQISGAGVQHFINCSCDVVFSDSSCSNFLASVGGEVVTGIEDFGKAVGGFLKKAGCSLGVSSCGKLTGAAKRAMYFACRQFGYTSAEIMQLDIVGFHDPSGKAQKDLGKSLMCFFLPSALSPADVAYVERYYHSLLACSQHKGVAQADPGKPPVDVKRSCMDGSVCDWLGGDSWKCHPGAVPPPTVISETNIKMAMAAHAKEVAARLGARICGISDTDPLEVSCANVQKSQECFQELGSCHSTDGLNWDEPCCTLKAGASATSPEIQRAQQVAAEVGPSCNVGASDPLEVDCATVGTYGKCLALAPACVSSDGWYWDHACCKVKGGSSNPGFAVRKATQVLKDLNSPNCRISQSDALEVQCKNVPDYVKCNKELPQACASSPNGFDLKPCCVLGWK